MLNLSVKRLIMRFSRVIWQLLLPSLKSNVSQEKRCSDLLSILTSCNRFFITYFARCFVGLQDTFTSKGISTALTVIYRIVLVLFSLPISLVVSHFAFPVLLRGWPCTSLYTTIRFLSSNWYDFLKSIFKLQCPIFYFFFKWAS